MTSTLPPIVQAVSGALGSASANALIYPLDLISSRIQLKKGVRRQNPLYILRDIVDRHGLSALYTGLAPDTGATLLSNFFYFYFYSIFRVLVLRRQALPDKKTKVTISVIQELALGLLAGAASRAISTPLNIITLRMQNAKDEDQSDTSSDDSSDMSEAEDGDATSLSGVVQGIYKKDGLAGFWKGFRTTLLLCLNPSLTLAVYQLCMRVILLAKTRRLRAGGSTTLVNPSPGQAFIGGAVASSIASAILYPLILAKTRVQASSSSSDTLLGVLGEAYSGKYNERRQHLGGPPPLASDDTPSFSDVVKEKVPPEVVHDVEKRSTRGTRRPRPKGLAAVYQGLETQILKGFLGQGVTFLVKRRIEQLIVDAYVRRYIRR
ncbi:mitochondrial carrier domain-containing protein [Schizophyllum amplum]|uniref:Mitochondrial carrier domain-containing protein n=1 Tax=Schizophyllum amplum TaxID=97359 RepID=A0A550CW04_9AGAR|nr:mitochondrial carrier domain-containing protein [Auriculariopsis ampla]